MLYVYILENKNDQSLYIGLTSNIDKRIRDHLSGRGAKTTRKKSGWQLIYLEGYLDRLDAVNREKFLKSGPGRKYLKKQLVSYFRLAE